MVLPPPDLAAFASEWNDGLLHQRKRLVAHRIPVAICEALLTCLLATAILKGRLVLKLNDRSQRSFGDGSAYSDDARHVTTRVFDIWFIDPLPDDQPVRKLGVGPSSESVFMVNHLGDVYATGLNDRGQLGVGDSENKNTLTKVVFEEGVLVEKISAAEDHALSR